MVNVVELAGIVALDGLRRATVSAVGMIVFVVLSGVRMKRPKYPMAKFSPSPRLGSHATNPSESGVLRQTSTSWYVVVDRLRGMNDLLPTMVTGKSLV